MIMDAVGADIGSQSSQSRFGLREVIDRCRDGWQGRRYEQ